MSTKGMPSAYDEARDGFVDMSRAAMHDAADWFQGLTDLERLMGLCGFIMALFVLVVVKATTRTAEPGHGRSFISSFVLVVVFSFLAGMVIDSDLDWRQYLPANFV